jgi:hypothetical protein
MILHYFNTGTMAMSGAIGKNDPETRIAITSPRISKSGLTAETFSAGIDVLNAEEIFAGEEVAAISVITPWPSIAVEVPESENTDWPRLND